MRKCKDCNREFNQTSGNEEFCTRCLGVFYMEVEVDDIDRSEYSYAEDNIPQRGED